MSAPASPTGICEDVSEGKVHNGYFLRRLSVHNYIEGGADEAERLDGAKDKSGADIIGESTRTGKLGQGVVAVETVNLGDGCTTLELTAGDKVGLMHKINSILFAWQLTVVKAAASTDTETGMAFEKYKVVESATNKELPQADHSALQDILIVALNNHTGGTVRKGSMFRDRSELAADVQELSIANEPGRSYTELRMTCNSRPGLLRDFTLELLKWNLSVQTFELHSDLKTSKYLINLTTAEGLQLDRLQIKMVQRRLQGADLASRAPSSDGTENSLNLGLHRQVSTSGMPPPVPLTTPSPTESAPSGPARKLLSAAAKCLRAGRGAAFATGLAVGLAAAKLL